MFGLSRSFPVLGKEGAMYRILGLAVAVVWGGFWTWFGLVSGITEKMTALGVLLHALVPGGLFLASVAVAWRWERPGAYLLLLEALLIAVVYPMLSGGRWLPFVLPTMALPPLVAGILLLSQGRAAAAHP
jgi:hypothetical protein